MRFSVLLLCFIICFSQAQKENNFWYFGFRQYEANFNTSPPVITWISRATYTVASTSSMADTAGNLLFHASSDGVFNRNHRTMANGGDEVLAAWRNVRQTSLVTPWPDSTDLYYVFSIGNAPALTELKVSTVDLRGDSSLGAIRTKNEVLLDSAARVTSLFHQNQKDLWIISHTLGNNTFKIYSLTAAGLDTIPKTQSIGSNHIFSEGGSIGFTKASHDGKYLAVSTLQFIEIFEFNNRTGELSNPIRIDKPGSEDRFYGFEFSPNGQFLYVSWAEERGSIQHLLRYSLKAPNIKASEKFMLRNTSRIYDLLLANDQQIYMSRFRGLGRITNPNAFKINIIDNNFKSSDLFAFGLPNFVRGYIPTVNVSGLCSNAPLQFNLNSHYPLNKVVWNFGDARPEVDQISPQHTYAKAGAYDVKVEYTYRDGRTFSMTQVIEVDSGIVKLDSLPVTCLNSPPIKLDQGSPKGGVYKGAGVDSKTGIFNPRVAGLGSFKITYIYLNSSYGCQDSTSQNITVQAPQVLTLVPGIDTFCFNSSATNLARVLPPGGTYIGRGVTGNQFSPLAAGIGTHSINYVSTDLCRSMRAFNLTVTAQGPQLRFFKTVSKDVCGSTVITFTNTSPAGTSGFTWTAGDGSVPVKSRNFTHTYTKAGTYTVVLKGDCGRTASEVIVVPPNIFQLQADTAICTGARIRLKVGGANTYTWKPTSSLDDPSSPNPLVSPTVTTDYVVKMEKGSCIIYDTVRVTVLPNVDLDFKAELVNGCDSLQTVILSNNAPADLTFTWQDEAGNQLTRIDKATIQSQKTRGLWVYMKHNLGSCSKRDSVFFKIGLNPNYLSRQVAGVKASSSTSCEISDSVQLEAWGGDSYLWQPRLGLSNPRIANPVASPATSTTYTVRITSKAGCVARRSVKVAVLASPKVDLKLETKRAACDQVPELSFKNKTSSATKYEWDFGDGNTSKLKEPVHRYSKGGQYEVKLRAVNANNCFVDTTFEVEVAKALAYNAFSPNGDGINEVLDLGLEGWELVVYNRWGKLVYQASNYKNDWSGGDLTAGTYYYVLRSPKGYSCRGWVALLK